MANTYHVHGPLYVQTKTNAGAYETLGMSEDGGEVNERHFYKDLMTDVAGDAPADRQFRGATAEISLTMSAWDSAVLTKILNLSKAVAAASAEGSLGAPGVLLGNGGFAFSLALQSSLDGPFWWTSAHLVDPGRPLGTQYGKVRCRFFAWVYLDPTVVTFGSQVLTRRTTPA